MATHLHNLQIKHGSTRKTKRVGRGNASGHGTFATRGQKGQKARSGVGGLKRLGMRSMLLATPKFKGMKPVTPKPAVINVAVLESEFAAEAVIQAATLVEKGLISSAKNGVKILGGGALTKKFTVIARAFSESAKAAIEKAGGKAIIKK